MTGGAATVRTVGRYALYEAIASGGMATIFLGRLMGPVGFARTVAIKRLHPHYASDQAFVTGFLDEARLVARIRHPNVVPTLDVVATGGELFVVMEYVHGEALSRLVKLAAEKREPIPIPVAVAVLSGALQGLAAAHEAKSERDEPLQIIHRDVSPQNILVGQDGQARLIDFGVARGEGRLHTTHAGQVKGKLAYMSPEQVRGEAIGPTADVYAAGVVLWETLTGQRLFRAAGDGGLVVQVLEAKVGTPSDAIAAAGDPARAEAARPLDAVVMRALAPSAAARWASARELVRALESAVAPATAAQVADWVEHVAGPILRERARIVATIESSSASDVTAGQFATALAPGVGPSLLSGPGSAAVFSSEPLTHPADTIANAANPRDALAASRGGASPGHEMAAPSPRATEKDLAGGGDASPPSSRGFGTPVETLVSAIAHAQPRQSPRDDTASPKKGPPLAPTLVSPTGMPAAPVAAFRQDADRVRVVDAALPPGDDALEADVALPLRRSPLFLFLGALAVVGAVVAAALLRGGH